MNVGSVLFLLGRMLLALGGALLIPAAVAWARDERALTAFLFSAGLALLAGRVLQHVFRQPEEFGFGRREAFLLVSAAWLTASVVGAVRRFTPATVTRTVSAESTFTGFTESTGSAATSPALPPAASRTVTPQPAAPWSKPVLNAVCNCSREP